MVLRAYPFCKTATHFHIGQPVNVVGFPLKSMHMEMKPTYTCQILEELQVINYGEQKVSDDLSICFSLLCQRHSVADRIFTDIFQVENVHTKSMCISSHISFPKYKLLPPQLKEPYPQTADIHKADRVSFMLLLPRLLFPQRMLSLAEQLYNHLLIKYSLTLRACLIFGVEEALLAPDLLQQIEGWAKPILGWAVVKQDLHGHFTGKQG